MHKSSNQYGVIQNNLSIQAVEQQESDKESDQEARQEKKHDQPRTWIIPVDQQKNAIDYGLYAIAYAIEFLSEEENPAAKYKCHEMRHHLMQCFESEEMKPFPKYQLRKRGSQAKIVEIII